MNGVLTFGLSGSPIYRVHHLGFSLKFISKRVKLLVIMSDSLTSTPPPSPSSWSLGLPSQGFGPDPISVIPESMVPFSDSSPALPTVEEILAALNAPVTGPSVSVAISEPITTRGIRTTHPPMLTGVPVRANTPPPVVIPSRPFPFRIYPEGTTVRISDEIYRSLLRIGLSLRHRTISETLDWLIREANRATRNANRETTSDARSRGPQNP